jgi:hypothetical protein
MEKKRNRIYYGHTEGGRIDIQPRFKIQYPMKNRGKYRVNQLTFNWGEQVFFYYVILKCSIRNWKQPGIKKGS